MDSSMFSRRDQILIGLTVLAAAAAGVMHYHPVGDLVDFIVAGLALALLAMLVGRSVEGLGDRLGPGATGVVQSALGNLPELFVVLFALNAGLVGVVQATIVGSILANVLLVLGLAFIAGGVKHGPQRFDSQAGRNLGILLLLAVLVLSVPGLTAALHTPAADHERELSLIVAFVLLAVFALSIPAALRRSTPHPAEGPADPRATDPSPKVHVEWPLWLALGMLAVTGVGAAFVSDWFVAALEPAISQLGISQTFAGLVIVAIAGNAVENVVGVQLAARNQADYALSVILQSPLQVSMIVAPAVLLLAPLVGAAGFTLVLPPVLIAVLIMSALVAVFVVFDGESTWLEGAVLVGLYVSVAAAFWWG